MTDLRISKDFSLPIDFVTQSIGIVASRGSGKTYTTKVFAEELLEQEVPTVILDPIGVYWGLRSSSDGSEPGFSIPILGGDRGDVPLAPTDGTTVARYVVEERAAAILDLSAFRKGEQRHFVTDFAEEIYRINKEPLHLILDEADLFIPQHGRKEEARMVGAFEDIVRRGRARGIGCSLVTQRPAVIHKDVLTQVSVLIALRMLGPQDRHAVEDWIKYHGNEAQKRTVLQTLGSLPIGTAWFWSPGWLQTLRKVAIRQSATWDSSATPKVGEEPGEPEEVAEVDVEDLREKLAETVERSKETDPRELHARIAELEKAAKGDVKSLVREYEERIRKLEAELRKAKKAPKAAKELKEKPPEAREQVGSTPTSVRVRDRETGVQAGSIPARGTEAPKVETLAERRARLAAPFRSAMPNQAAKDGYDLAMSMVKERPPFEDALPAAMVLPPYGVPMKGWTVVEEDLYQKFKARFIAELKDEAPQILKVLATAPELEVTTHVKVIELSDETIRGRVAMLVADGFFDDATNANSAFRELVRTGVKVATPSVYKECDALAGLGILTKEKDGYRVAPGAKVRLKKAS